MDIIKPYDSADTRTIAARAGTVSSQARWVKGEPALSDMLADPITQLLMRRDGVQETELRRLVQRLNAAGRSRAVAKPEIRAE